MTTAEIVVLIVLLACAAEMGVVVWLERRYRKDIRDQWDRLHDRNPVHTAPDSSHTEITRLQARIDQLEAAEREHGNMSMRPDTGQPQPPRNPAPPA